SIISSLLNRSMAPPPVIPPAPVTEERSPPSLYAEIVHDPLRRFAALEHRGHDEVRAAHHVAAGEDLRVRGLETRLGRARHARAAVPVQLDAELREPFGGAGPEAERDDHRVRRQHLLGARHDLRTPPAAGSR